MSRNREEEQGPQYVPTTDFSTGFEDSFITDILDGSDVLDGSDPLGLDKALEALNQVTCFDVEEGHLDTLQTKAKEFRETRSPGEKYDPSHIGDAIGELGIVVNKDNAITLFTQILTNKEKDFALIHCFYNFLQKQDYFTDNVKDTVNELLFKNMEKNVLGIAHNLENFNNYECKFLVDIFLQKNNDHESALILIKKLCLGIKIKALNYLFKNTSKASQDASQNSEDEFLSTETLFSDEQNIENFEKNIVSLIKEVANRAAEERVQGLIELLKTLTLETQDLFFQDLEVISELFFDKNLSANPILQGIARELGLGIPKQEALESPHQEAPENNLEYFLNFTYQDAQDEEVKAIKRKKFSQDFTKFLGNFQENERQKIVNNLILQAVKDEKTQAIQCVFGFFLDHEFNVNQTIGHFCDLVNENQDGFKFLLDSFCAIQGQQRAEVFTAFCDKTKESAPRFYSFLQKISHNDFAELTIHVTEFQQGLRNYVDTIFGDQNLRNDEIKFMAQLLDAYFRTDCSDSLQNDLLGFITHLLTNGAGLKDGISCLENIKDFLANGNTDENHDFSRLKKVAEAFEDAQRMQDESCREKSPSPLSHSQLAGRQERDLV